MKDKEEWYTLPCPCEYKCVLLLFLIVVVIVCVCVCLCVCLSVCVCVSVLEIVVSIQTLSDHFGILSDPKEFGSDIWLSTTHWKQMFTSQVQTMMLVR